MAQSQKAKRRKETLRENMLELYKDPELYAQKLFFEMQRETLMGADFKIFHPVGQFVLTYDLFPCHIAGSVLINKEELGRLYLKFIDQNFRYLHSYFKEDYDQIHAMWEKWGIEKYSYGSRRTGEYKRNIFYIINKDHKLNILEDK
jgi:hypothetical protein